MKPLCMVNIIDVSLTEIVVNDYGSHFAFAFAYESTFAKFTFRPIT